MKRNNFFKRSLLFASLLLATFSLYAASPTKKVRILYMDDNSMTSLRISPNGSVLNFPLKPSKIVLGKQGSFAVEMIESDVAIAPGADNARSNLFIYMLGKRYAFSLSVDVKAPDEIIQIRDKSENLIRIKEP